MPQLEPRRLQGRTALRACIAGATALAALSATVGMTVVSASADPSSTSAKTARNSEKTTSNKSHPKKAKTFDLQLLSFNDFHGHLESGDSAQSPLPANCVPDKPVEGCTPPVGGVEYLASHIKALRANQPKTTLTVAAGDLIGGSTFLSGLFQDQPTIEAMNTLGLDFSSVGNHEFDEGTDELLRMARGGCQTDGCFKDSAGEDIPFEGANFKYLAANVIKKSNGKPLLPGTSVRKVKGVKIGFIGMTLEATPTLVSPAGVSSVTFRDEVKTANQKARDLKKRGVESIIVLLHEGGYQSAGYSGCAQMSGPILDIAKRLNHKIDAVVTGHTHQPYVCKIRDPHGKRRLVTSAASYGQVLTEAHLTINKRTGDVRRHPSFAKNILVTRDVAKHRGETNLIKFWQALSEPLAARVVGSVAEDIVGDSSTCRCEETPMGDLVSDAILFGTEASEAGGAQIAFMNTGGIRASLRRDAIKHGEAVGDITYDEAYAVAPFNNLLVTVDMTGQQIVDVLNQQYQKIDSRGSRPMLSLGVSKGFSYTWEWVGAAPEPNKQPTDSTVGGHVVSGSATLNGVPLVPSQTYRVATLNFLADGGDSFTAFTGAKNRLGGAEDLANFVAFLDANPGLTAPEDRVNGL